MICGDTAPPRKPEERGFSVGIIGAGVAGLQQARAFRERGVSVTVFERADNIGGVWRANYSSFGIQVPSQLYDFPDFPLKKRTALGDLFTQDYPSGAEVQAHIEAYADHFELRGLLSLETKVHNVVPRGGAAAGWTFTLERAGKRFTQTFDYAVVATGLYSSTPFVPKLPGLKEFQAAGGRVLHSNEYRAADMAKGRRVLVIGGAKSAIDVSMEVVKNGGALSSTLLYRNAHWGTPRLLLWLIPFQYVFLSRLGQLLVSLFKGPFPYGAPSWLAPAHAALSWLLRLVFRLVEELIALQLWQYGDFRPSLDVVADFYGYGHVLSPEFQSMRRSGALKAVRGEVVRLQPGKAVVASPAPAPGCCGGQAAKRGGGADADAGPYAGLTEESELEVDMVICATGFGKDYSFLAPAVEAALQKQSDGLYLYRGMFPPAVPGLAFCGSEVASISNIMTHALHAEYIARVATGQLALPSAEAMWAEVEAVKKWKRSWMPHTPSRASLVLLHQVHYHDQLLVDMGLPWAAKGNPIATALMPYQPNDYDGVLGSGASKELSEVAVRR